MTPVEELPCTAIEPSAHTLTLRDGTALFYRAWLPDRPTTRALLLFHRGHEHSGRWQETVEALGFNDIAVFAPDARGHGRSDGERGAAHNLGDVIRDIDFFARHAIPDGAARVLDVGCGWGATMRRLVERHDVGAIVGMTLSENQSEFISRDPKSSWLCS